ncbi:uncharacterized protein DUF349 [Balneicella halophila]|uniref:Uncharacterized protein DUF349 n=1 Tax=Balneicella halophila TaxID=1537566 RepID=A0A7L4UTB9_BALHA|nr:DUF349 domain-containing protein [Balneicella halophila]PVX52597.1 uncharacterized protein DUF349 [Balneicella halophila]
MIMPDQNQNPLDHEDKTEEALENKSNEQENVSASNENNQNIVKEEKEAPTAKSNEEVKEVAKAPEAKEVSEADKAVTSENSNEERPAEGNNDEENEKTSTPSISARLKDTDFSTYTEEKMVATLRLLIEEADLTKIKELVDRLQATFYRRYNQEKNKERTKFIEEGGKPEEFTYSSLYEEQFKGLLAKYRDKKAEYNKKLEAEKQKNLERKYEIIEGIKNLINKQESLSETFKEFHALQDEWKSIGLVPLSNVNELWRNYHFHVENFYDYIRINKELRDLDFKKNLEIKTKLLEEAKSLVDEPSVKKSFDRLQKLHNKWKETGPVKRELREELWLEFKEASKAIHKKHQEYFVKLKSEQKENLAKKEILCEKAEALLTPMPTSNKQWNKVASIVKELQEEWKTIGFAPKKQNQAIYDRFRKACDTFFQAKRDAHKAQREEFKQNMAKKIQLCEMAEAVMDSEDWNMTTDYLIELQKQWKEVGPVQYKYSQKLWDRFRTACDRFFDRRSGKVEAASEEQQKENLEKKQAIIQKIEDFNVDESENALKELQQLQTEFHATGYVPIDEKKSVTTSFDKAVKGKLEKLEITEEEMQLQQYMGKYTAIIQEPDGENRVVKERLRLANKVKQIENNIVVWGNNIGFFNNSSNAEKLIAEVEQNISEAKEELKTYYQKLRFLDKLLQ